MCDVYSLRVAQLGGILQVYTEEDQGYHNDVASMLDLVDLSKLVKTF